MLFRSRDAPEVAKLWGGRESGPAPAQTASNDPGQNAIDRIVAQVLAEMRGTR